MKEPKQNKILFLIILIAFSLFFITFLELNTVYTYRAEVKGSCCPSFEGSTSINQGFKK